jgi:hypothetical protein
MESVAATMIGEVALGRMCEDDTPGRAPPRGQRPQNRAA